MSASGSSAYSRPKLSPEQLIEIARQSSNPRFVPQVITSPSPAPQTPGGITPTTFTPLPPDIYLPFVDRPAEVAVLLSTPPTMKLFSLLAQTFPKAVCEDHDEDDFPADPSSWSFQTLRLWLTTVDRPTADDSLWVHKARRCVLTHSELIWERLKGALGVPPELEWDDGDNSRSAAASADEDDVAHGISDPSLNGAVTDIAEETEISSMRSPISPPATSPPNDVIIETIIATLSFNSHTPSNPPPLSLTASMSPSGSMNQGDGLQDIGEEAEEENADNNLEEKSCEPENQIHGLSISTCPISPSVAPAPYVFSYPSSPVESVVYRSPVCRDGGFPSRSSVEDSESERIYDPVGDRSPGNPLFPSNFARLALGPTLRAKYYVYLSSLETRWETPKLDRRLGRR
ncbi:hypothetical protein ID866_9076 [Astraeus odoratus]|nr:hypothetical protein ID866_9076 [Astraeus odoratus]